MAHVPSELAHEGMTLARDVLDGRGRLLIPAGKQLTERHVGALRSWGIAVIEVDGAGPEAKASDQHPPHVLARAEEEVAARFALTGEPSPFLHTLRSEAVARTARRIARAGGGGEP